jgi:hypothetical protein
LRQPPRLVRALAAGRLEVQAPSASGGTAHPPPATAGARKPGADADPRIAGTTLGGRRELGSLTKRPSLAVAEPPGEPGRLIALEQVQLVAFQAQVSLDPQVAAIPAESHEVPVLEVQLVAVEVVDREPAGAAAVLAATAGDQLDEPRNDGPFDRVGALAHDVEKAGALLLGPADERRRDDPGRSVRRSLQGGQPPPGGRGGSVHPDRHSHMLFMMPSEARPASSPQPTCPTDETTLSLAQRSLRDT